MLLKTFLSLTHSLLQISGSIDSLGDDDFFFRRCLFVCCAYFLCCRSYNKFHHQRNFTTRFLPFHPLIFFFTLLCVYFLSFGIIMSHKRDSSKAAAQVYINIDFFNIDLLFNLYRYIMKCFFFKFYTMVGNFQLIFHLKSFHRLDLHVNIYN